MVPEASSVLSKPHLGMLAKVSITCAGLPGDGISFGSNLCSALYFIYNGSKSALRGILTSSGSPKKWSRSAYANLWASTNAVIFSVLEKDSFYVD